MRHHVIIDVTDDGVTTHGDSHAATPGLALVVPLERLQLVALHRRERVDEVRAEVERHVLGHELARRRSVLRPVRVVTHPLVLVGCVTAV